MKSAILKGRTFFMFKSEELVPLITNGNKERKRVLAMLNILLGKCNLSPFTKILSPVECFEVALHMH